MAASTYHPRIMITLVIISLSSACAAGGGTLSLKAKYPENPYQRHHATSKTVLIRDVTDDREFEAQPVPLSVHSYAGEKPAADQLAAIIGARSGEEGKDFNNIYLEYPQNVKKIMSDLPKVALEYAGYKVVTIEKDSDKEPDVVAEIVVQRFWIWMTPGTATIAVESVIQVEVNLTSKKEGTASIAASGSHEDMDVSKSPSSYSLALNEAINNLLVDLQEKCLEIADAGKESEGEGEGQGEPE
jgi:hypothetical protein